jgi:hypothetical protein
VSTLDTIAINGNIKAIGATIVVEQGYKAHSIRLTPEDFAAVSAGQAICVRGNEYVYEGETFYDYWNFNATSAGSLQIECGDDSGIGFDGLLRNATIKEHTPE